MIGLTNSKAVILNWVAMAPWGGFQGCYSMLCNVLTVGYANTIQRFQIGIHGDKNFLTCRGLSEFATTEELFYYFPVVKKKSKI